MHDEDLRCKLTARVLRVLGRVDHSSHLKLGHATANNQYKLV
jgi:hypothetical protein